MLTSKITETEIETFGIELIEKLGYQYLYGPDIAPDSETPERERFEDVVLLERLRTAVARINPSIPADVREEAIKQVQRLNSPELIANNEAFHRMLTEGIKVVYPGWCGTRRAAASRCRWCSTPARSCWRWITPPLS